MGVKGIICNYVIKYTLYLICVCSVLPAKVYVAVGPAQREYQPVR